MPDQRQKMNTGSPGTPKIAYIMSRFPKLTETFILYEMLAIRNLGVQVEIYPLIRERQPVAHKEAAELTSEAHFYPAFSLNILKAHWHYLKCCPKKYLATMFEIFKGTFGSLNFFLGALGLYPKSVRFAYDMARTGVTHVHAHFATHPAVAALIINRLTDIPFSFTAHGSDLHKERRMLDKKISASAFAAAISSYNRRIMIEECQGGCGEKIHVVHCGVEPEVFSYSPHRDNTTFQILCVGSFEEVKGHRYLVDACKSLAERGYDFECHFIGEGPQRLLIEKQIAESGIAPRFHVHGGLPRDRVLQFLHQVDVKVLASVKTAEGKREGIPVVLMEAMACGVPVVASRISGIPELVEDGVSGLLSPPGDSAALSERLQQLYCDIDLRHRLAENARRKIESDFNLELNARRLLGLITSPSGTKVSRPADNSGRRIPASPDISLTS